MTRDEDFKRFASKIGTIIKRYGLDVNHLISRSTLEFGPSNTKTIVRDFTTPLAEAVINQNNEDVKLLLALGADPNMPHDGKEGAEPIYFALGYCSKVPIKEFKPCIPILKALIQAGADLDKRDPYQNLNVRDVARSNGFEKLLDEVARPTSTPQR